MSPRPTFELELKELKLAIEKMGKRLQSTFELLLEAIAMQEKSALKEISQNDPKINSMERDIEARCLYLITTQQPIARDLRFVSAALKAVTDMERIGDQLADIAELVLRMDTIQIDSVSEHMEQLFEVTKKWMERSLDVFIHRKKEKIEEVINGDDEVDDLFNKVKEDIVDYLKNETKSVDECIDFLMIAKYMERIGDHSVNICEWEMFNESGNINDDRIL